MGVININILESLVVKAAVVPKPLSQ